MKETNCERMSIGNRSFWEDQEGVGTVELVLILVVLIGIVIIFRSSISNLLTSLFDKIQGEALAL